MEKYMQYNLMQMKKKHAMSSMNSSWEEEAFAEDSMGPLGGFLWPPRSYSCTFCNREFSSAQGLGGHMNVHRRDRAKLQQSPDRKDEVHNPNSPVVKSSFSARFYQESSFHHDHLHGSPSSSPRRTTLEENTRRGKQVLKYDGEMISCRNKRPKKTGVPSMEIFQKNSSLSLEDIDLELRLGDPPAVK